MKRLAFILIFAFLPPAFAGQWTIGERTSAFLPDDDNFSHKPQLQTGINLTYFFNKTLAVELEISNIRFNSSKTRYTNGSQFKEAFILINGQLRLPLNDRFSLYGVYGYGIAFYYDKHLDRETLSANMSQAAKYGAGFDYKLNKKIALNIEGAYYYSDTERSSIDTWGWSIGTGLKYYF